MIKYACFLLPIHKRRNTVMKLVINYDLLKKIFEAKHGIDLKFLDT